MTRLLGLYVACATAIVGGVIGMFLAAAIIPQRAIETTPHVAMMMAYGIHFSTTTAVVAVCWPGASCVRTRPMKHRPPQQGVNR